MTERVVLYGAAGHTGGFIAAELAKRGFEPILAGRDAAKLGPIAERLGVEGNTAEIDDAAALDALLAGTAALINAAGPFGDTSPPLIEAALSAKLPYLDVTAEPFVARTIFDSFAEPARKAGTIVAPAFGFFGALGDLLVTAALDGVARADSVELAFALDRWQPTKGTLLAGKRRGGRRLVRTRGRFETREPAEQPPRGAWHFPPPFGEQPTVGEFSTVDVVTISRHIDVDTIATWINEAPLADLATATASGPFAADSSGRSAQQFIVEAVVRSGSGERRVRASGRDIYAITAPIVVEAVSFILNGRSRSLGVVSPGELFDARSFLATLSPDPISIDFQ